MSWPSKVFSGNLVSIGLLETENWSDDLDIYHICLWTKYAYAVEIYQAMAKVQGHLRSLNYDRYFTNLSKTFATWWFQGIS